MALPLTYKCNNCFINCFINKRHYYKDKNLKYVIGSIGFNGWFEYGGKNWTKKDFERRHTEGSISWDAHAWLEDDDGNVYDYIFQSYNDVALTATRRPLTYTGLIEGKSKQWCEDNGLSYVAADMETSKTIFLSIFKFLTETEHHLQTKKIVWCGDKEVGFLTTRLGRVW